MRSTRQLEGLSARLPKPKAVLCGLGALGDLRSHVLASAHPRTIHDFSDFPRPLYEVQYPAPGALKEAKTVASNPRIALDDMWAGPAWSVLRHMYP